MNREQRRARARADRLPSQRPTKQSPPTVVIGIVNPGEVSMACMASVIRVRDFMVQYGLLPGFLERRARSQHVWRARNELVKGFLETGCEWLWFVDADMGLQQDALVKLLSAAHVEERPIVAGLCFAQRDIGFVEDDYSTVFDTMPTIQLFNLDDEGDVRSFSIVTDYPRDTVVKIDATGGACVLIHKSVLEKLQAEFGEHWFTPLTNPTKGTPFGEDTSFFVRCHKLGIPVHLHTGCRTSHYKGGVYLTEALWDAQQAARA